MTLPTRRTVFSIVLAMLCAVAVEVFLMKVLHLHVEIAWVLSFFGVYLPVLAFVCWPR